MGFLNRLFTGKEDQNDAVRRMQKALTAIEGEVQRLADKHDELASEHRKLRGRFYAARGEVEAAPQTREAMKVATLSRLGYVPGQPAPHRG
jgi:predicted nuclease with TOPRIM domain